MVANEVVEIVRVIEGLNRFRFAGDPDLFAACESGQQCGWAAEGDGEDDPPEAPPAGDEVKPAA